MILIPAQGIEYKLIIDRVDTMMYYCLACDSGRVELSPP